MTAETTFCAGKKTRKQPELEKIDLMALVPVLNRPQNVQPLIDSWAASRAADHGMLVFVAEDGDLAELEAIGAADNMGSLVSQVVTPQNVSTWPQKIDWAWKTFLPVLPTVEWVLLAADDIDFHYNWYDATRKLREKGFQVIGTNDLGNARVMAGDHATHPLVRRDFTAVDDPDSPVHTGYHHWCVDDELVTTAKARGVWAPCLDSVVEHLHPYFKKGAMDEVYLEGERHNQADRDLFEARLPLLVQEAADHNRTLIATAP